MTTPTAGIAFPVQAGVDGRTARVAAERRIADLVEAVLLTAPGERVNRPDFGCGLNLLLFAPVDPAVVATAELAARSGLQRWLGDLIDVGDVSVELDDTAVRVLVQYRIKVGGQQSSLVVEVGS